MTGSAKVKPARTNAQWARNTQKRLDQVENPSSARVGPWVLTADPDTGDLLASHVNGGAVVLANPPVNTEDADSVASQEIPFIKLERQANQVGTRGTPKAVEWDTILSQTESWGYTEGSPDLAIPKDGLYLVHYSLSFLNSSNAVNKAMFTIDGVVEMSQEFDPSDAWYQSFYLSEIFALSAGSVVQGMAYVSGSGSFDFGTSGADPAVSTSLSLYRLPIGA